MPRLLISIPVHEKHDVVMDQVRNVLHYNPSSTVVLHVSKEFKSGFLSRPRFVATERLLVNEARQSTKALGLLSIHLNNYRYARTRCEFDAFVLNASNDMYVREGAETYVTRSDAVVRPVPVPPDSDWSHAPNVRRHDYLSRLLALAGGSAVCASTPEGTAYSKAMMNEMFVLLTERLPYERSPAPYPDEETILPTLAACMGGSRSLPFVLSEITIGRAMTPAIVEAVRAGTFRAPDKIFYGSPDTNPMYDFDNLYAVKRVARDLDDPLRRYINALEGNA